MRQTWSFGPFGFPERGFDDLDAARGWAAEFTSWYNVEHRHSGIRYVSSAQRHADHDTAILAARSAVYEQARQRHHARWSRGTRDWSPITTITLNPEWDLVVAAELRSQDIQPRVA